MGNFLTNIFKRNSSKVTVETSDGLVHKSESSESVPFISALTFGMRNNISALKLSAVYAAISLISNAIAALPIYVKQHKDNTDTILENNPIQKLFYNMLQTKHTAIKQLVWDLLLWGNAFMYIKRKDGKPDKLIYLQHGDVQVDYKKEQDLVQYNVNNHNAIPKLVKQEDMIHFAKDTYDGINGRGFMYFASDIINLAGFTQKAAEDFFGSGCNLTGILQFKRPLKPGQQEQIRSQWMQIHSSGQGGLGVLEGDSEYIPISQNSADAQMLETREFNITEIARFFNINPVLLGDLSHSSYNDIEQSQIEFVTHTLLPIINLFEDELNRKLITNSRQYIDLDESELMKGNMTTLANYYSTLVSNGIITIDESRKQLGFNPFNDGYSNKILIPYTKISDNIINQDNTDETNDNVEEQQTNEQEV